MHDIDPVTKICKRCHTPMSVLRQIAPQACVILRTLDATKLDRNFVGHHWSADGADVSIMVKKAGDAQS